MYVYMYICIYIHYRCATVATPVCSVIECGRARARGLTSTIRYACVCMYVSVCMHVCMIYVRMHVCACLCVSVSLYVCMHVCERVCMHACMVSTHVYTGLGGAL